MLLIPPWNTSKGPLVFKTIRNLRFETDRQKTITMLNEIKIANTQEIVPIGGGETYKVLFKVLDNHENWNKDSKTQ